MATCPRCSRECVFHLILSFDGPDPSNWECPSCGRVPLCDADGRVIDYGAAEIEWACSMARRLRTAAAKVDGYQFQGVSMTKDEAERLAGAIELLASPGHRTPSAARRDTTEPAP